MDYEKKYKELVGKIEKAYLYAQTDSTKAVLEDIFPELKESEDEGIRKDIIAIFKGQIPYTSEEDAKKYIAWLEKQGSQNLANSAKTCKNESFDYENANIQQKDFAPKVEPKFKVGDWIIDVQGVSVNQIVGYEDDSYHIRTSCSEFYLPMKLTEKNYHLWSINDAKPGDVLQLGLVTAIFEKIIGNGNCMCYCSVCSGEFEIPSQDGADNSYGCHNATPATKEQCDLLFQKMKEVGYEWDAEKLEPIKVPKTKEPEGALKHLLDEQEKLYKEAENILEDKDTALAFLRRTGIIDEYGELAEKYRSNQTPATTIIAVNGTNSTAISDGNTSVTSKEVERQYCTGQYEPDVGEFPIEWKQENVDELSKFEMAMMHIGRSFFGEKAGLDPNDTTTIKEQAKLLLELVTKQEWSEEDEKMLNSIIHSADNHCYINVEERNWLKSLKDRYAWKPTDEQMDNLSRAFNGATYRTSLLRDLYLDLKKLKGD